MNESTTLTEHDFPMGRGYPRGHPKRRLLSQLIEENASEYARAPQKTGFQSPCGRFIRSRFDIITGVIRDMMVGRFMVKQKNNAVWTARAGFDSNTSEVRIMVQERFNALIRSWRGDLPPLQPSEPQSAQNEVGSEGGDELMPGPAPCGVGEALLVDVEANVIQPHLENVREVDSQSDSVQTCKDNMADESQSAGSSKLSSMLQSIDLSPTSTSPDAILNEIHGGDALQDDDSGPIDGMTATSNASIGTFSTSINSKDVARGSELVKSSTSTDDNDARNHSLLQQITSRIETVSISTESIGTFTAANDESMKLSTGSSNEDIHAEAIHSTKSTKVRQCSSDPPGEAKHEGSDSASIAPDSPMTVVFDSLSLLDDEVSFNDNTAKELATSDQRSDRKPQGRRKKVLPHAKSTQSFVTLTNLEIAVNDVDMSTGFGNVGGISAKQMLSELSRHSLHVNEIKRLLDELSDRAINDDRQLRGKDVLDCAVEVVSNTMKGHVQDVSVLSKALIFVSQLFANHGIDSIQISDDFVAQTMRVLQLHHNDADLLCDGWRLLQTLTFCDSNARKAIAKSNGIVLILNGVRQHSMHAGIQGAGCFFLGYLALDNPENQRKIADSNGIDLTLQAMRRHEEEEDIQDWGCFALAKLAENHRVNQRAMIDANGVKVIQQAMRRFSERWEVQNFGGVVLDWLQ